MIKLEKYGTSTYWVTAIGVGILACLVGVVYTFYKIQQEAGDDKTHAQYRQNGAHPVKGRFLVGRLQLAQIGHKKEDEDDNNLVEDGRDCLSCSIQNEDS